MRVALNRQAELLAWANEHIPGARFSEKRETAIGVVSEDDSIMGVVVFHDWRPKNRTIMVSAASADERWMACRKAFDSVFLYAFEVCGVDKIWAETPASNKRALQLAWSLGLRREAVLERHLGDDDVIISRIFKWEYEKLPRQRAIEAMRTARALVRAIG